MPVCHNCDSEEFVVHDGLFFCAICQSQSQEVVEEEIDKFSSKAHAVEQIRSAPKMKKVVDEGKPWHIVEAFQLILRSQIDALIHMGCSPQVCDVAKELWFKYLHKSGIVTIDSTTSGESLEPNGEMVGESGKRKVTGGRKKKIHDLTLNRLIILLNIALQWCKQTVTVGDLIHLIQQGDFPYIDCLKTLLPHMKLSGYDAIAIRHDSIPSYQNIVVQTTQMIEYLEISEELPDVNIHQLVIRYINELNLPLTMIPFVLHFMMTTKYKYKRNRNVWRFFYSPEGAALSLIVVACKLLFGLNDEKEWMLEEKATNCNEHDACKPFSWKEWVKHHIKREKKTEREPAHCFELFDCDGVEDIHSCVRHWKDLVLKSYSRRKVDESGYKDVKLLKERADLKAWPFMKLRDFQGSNSGRKEASVLSQSPSSQDENYFRKSCLQHALKLSEENNCYVWYSDSFSRVEECFCFTQSSCNYSISEDFWCRGEMNVHMSYDMLLSIMHNVSTVDKVLLHCLTQGVERDYLSHHLEVKKNHGYVSSSWTNIDRPRRCKRF